MANLESEDLVALKDGVSSVLDDLCSSLALHAFVDGKSELDAALWTQARDLGWLAIAAPESHDGLSGGAPGASMLMQELGRRIAPGPFLPTVVASLWLDEAGSDTQKDAYLSAIAAGELSAALPVDLSAAPGQTLRMIGAPDAGLLIVPTGPDEWGLVEGGSAAARLLQTWDRTRQVFEIELDRAEIVSRIQDPAQILAKHYDLAVAADSLGAGRAAFDITVEYMKTRVQFGKPIGSFQALKHRVANLLALLAAAEQSLAQAVDAADAGSPDAGLWAALAKSEVTTTAAHVAGDCVQLHGGVGFTSEFDIQLYVKRGRLNEALVQSNHKRRDVAAELLIEAVRQGRSPAELTF